MGEVPANWYSESMDSWSQNARGSFPESTNQIQLYKKTFTVANITQVSGVVLSIRYKYGCIVYLNGHEAWRNGVSGTLSASSIATQSYDELLYRVVTLPGRSIPENPNDAPVDFIQQGVNTIAILGAHGFGHGNQWKRHEPLRFTVGNDHFVHSQGSELSNDPFEQ